MSAFPIVLKDFAIVYYVTIAPYDSKSSWRYHVCLNSLVLADLHELSYDLIFCCYFWLKKKDLIV